ncbi:hypothetical protein FO519_009552 [Halicephalobus sp. NKZ332]|nr:hypothetical protein FO519_009552 [Halicephalobus sp. NKZ332]
MKIIKTSEPDTVIQEETEKNSSPDLVIGTDVQTESYSPKPQVEASFGDEIILDGTEDRVLSLEDIPEETQNPVQWAEDFNSYPQPSVVRDTFDEDFQHPIGEIPNIPQVSYFEKILGKGFSKYNDEEICRRMLQIFELRPLQHIYVLDTENRTPEHDFIALQNNWTEISFAIFNDHPMSEELIQSIGNIAHHLDVVYFKGLETTNLSLH